MQRDREPHYYKTKPVSADHDAWAATIRERTRWGHDVVAASDTGRVRAADWALLRKAASRARIVITRDCDFGRPVFARVVARTISRLQHLWVHNVDDEGGPISGNGTHCSIGPVGASTGHIANETER